MADSGILLDYNGIPLDYSRIGVMVLSSPICLTGEKAVACLCRSSLIFSCCSLADLLNQSLVVWLFIQERW